MKKLSLLLATTLFFTSTVCLAQSRTSKGLSEAEKLAITAGAAQACLADSDKLKNYEVIVSRILVNPTVTEKEETEILTTYAQKKLQVYKEQKNAPEMDCLEVLRRFDNLPIFKSVVYKDGTIQLPDGRKIKPKRPVKQVVTTQPGTKKETAKKKKLKPFKPKTTPKKEEKKPFRPKVIQ